MIEFISQMMETTQKIISQIEIYFLDDRIYFPDDRIYFSVSGIFLTYF